jgi:hypothetical protein
MPPALLVLVLVLRQGLTNFAWAGLLTRDPPVSASQASEITDLYHHTHLHLLFLPKFLRISGPSSSTMVSG